MKTDHKAALKTALEKEHQFDGLRNLKAVYLELRELAKAFYNDPSHGTPTAYALRAAIGEE
jgi:hypothetical protein